MDKLKEAISQYGRWSSLKDYTDRIETFLTTDFSQSVENVKALLETIGKEICYCKGIELNETSSLNAVLKKAFIAIGYPGEDLVTQISSALASIGQQVSELRNSIGSISHGRTLAELEERNNKIDKMTKEFLIDSTVIVACFLIHCFENENPRVSQLKETSILYEDNNDFNDFWDGLYGDFDMGEYSYSASEILYNVDYLVYITEKKIFESGEGEE